MARQSDFSPLQKPIHKPYGVRFRPPYARIAVATDVTLDDYDSCVMMAVEAVATVDDLPWTDVLADLLEISRLAEDVK